MQDMNEGLSWLVWTNRKGYCGTNRSHDTRHQALLLRRLCSCNLLVHCITRVYDCVPRHPHNAPEYGIHWSWRCSSIVPRSSCDACVLVLSMVNRGQQGQSDWLVYIEQNLGCVILTHQCVYLYIHTQWWHSRSSMGFESATFWVPLPPPNSFFFL